MNLILGEKNSVLWDLGGFDEMKIVLVDDYLVFCSGMFVMLCNLFEGVEIIEVGD